MLDKFENKLKLIDKRVIVSIPAIVALVSCIMWFGKLGPFQTTQGDYLLTFCTKDEFKSTVKNFAGTDTEMMDFFRQHCEGFTHFVDGCPTEWNGGMAGGQIFLECRSNCGASGTGIWSGLFYESTREPVSELMISVYPVCVTTTTTTLISTTTTTTLMPTTTTMIPSMPNPASVYCIEQGYKLELRTDATTGGQYGVCVFPDGSECEEWAFYEGRCFPPTCGGISVGGVCIEWFVILLIVFLVIGVFYIQKSE